MHVPGYLGCGSGEEQGSRWGDPCNWLLIDQLMAHLGLSMHAEPRDWRRHPKRLVRGNARPRPIRPDPTQCHPPPRHGCRR